MRNMNRREFLKTSAASAAGAAVLGIAGCAPKVVSEAPAAPAEETEVIDYESQVQETVDADVVVVGAGSGMFAAIVTAQAGLKTLVIDKGPNVLSTNTNIIGGTTAAETKVQKEVGNETTTEQVYDHMMHYAQGKVNQVLVKRCLEGSRACLDLWKDLGCEIILGADRYNTGFESVHVFLTPNKAQLLEDAFTGAGGTCAYNTTALDLVKDASGAVTGLYAKGAEDKIIKYTAKAVVLSTGGFLQDKEMMDTYFSPTQRIGKYTISQDDGAGIKMALRAGAVMDTCFAIGSLADAGGFNEHAAATFLTNMNKALCFGTLGNVQVDSNGERFINEYYIASNPLAFGGAIQARIGYYYAIVDQKCVDDYMADSPYTRLGRPDFWSVGALLFDNPYPTLQDDLNTAIEEKWAWKADTIEELAAAAGLPNLAAEIQSFNANCESGVDPILGMREEFLIPLTSGPFYAVQYQCGGLSTMGGIKTNNFCQAVDANFKTIPGLYVTGSENGSAFTSPYYDVGGTCSGICFGSNYVAGQDIVSKR